MTTPLARAEFALANSRALSALTGRILAAPAINRSPNAWAPSVYNGGGLIVSMPNVETVAGLRDALWDVLDDFNCRSEGPEWLPDPGEPVPPASFVPSTAGSSSVLAGGVKIIPKTADAGQNVGAPDPWPIVEALRARIGPDLVVSVGLNHLMSSPSSSAEIRWRWATAGWAWIRTGRSDWGGHGPVTLVSPSRPSVTGQRPRVVVLDTGIGDHPRFRADPGETTVRFDGGGRPRSSAPAVGADQPSILTTTGAAMQCGVEHRSRRRCSGGVSTTIARRGLPARRAGSSCVAAVGTPFASQHPTAVTSEAVSA